MFETQKEAPQDWDQWIDEHAPFFLLFARQLTKTAADAEDVLQEALIESWKRSDGKPSHPLVLTTIRRRSIDLARKQARRKSLVEVSHQDPTFQLYSTLSSSTDTPPGWLPALQSALTELPMSQREVITLKIWGGLTFAEIADALEIAAGTAASRYRLALTTLRQSSSLHPSLLHSLEP